MYNHEPQGHECFVCSAIAGHDAEEPWTMQSDVIYRDEATTAWINARWWGSIEGNAIVVPNDHHENLFDLPSALAGPVHATVQKVATAMMEVYGCAGISTRQHNGPAGNQDAWHFHVHVFPRNDRNDLYGQPARLASSAERRPFADKLRSWLDEQAT